MSVKYPTQPSNCWWQAWATLTAIGRELSYPQCYISNRWLSWMTPPPLGRVLFLLAYWAVIIYMMVAGAVVTDAFYWERIGFRNAWVTVMQVPLLYLLAAKTSIIGLLAGTSYERLNWLHRWVARTMLVTATVHGGHFLYQWALADFVQIQLQMMPMVKYGMGGWAILLWLTVTSLKPFRSMAYEIFLVQHIIAAVVFLWVIYVHIPKYARYNVWFAIAALCFDRAVRLALLVWRNIRFSRPDPSTCQGAQRFGHEAELTVIGESTTLLTIKDVDFKWKAGQHLYLWLPRVGPFESHPYTIACRHQQAEAGQRNSIQLVVRAHTGFSRRLLAFAKKLEAGGGEQTVTAMVAGPYGQPLRWDVYETLVLISASTGASFTLPILESVLQSATTMCTKRVDFLLAARQGEEISFYLKRLQDALKRAGERGLELSVHIAVTGHGQLDVVSAAMASSSNSSNTWNGLEVETKDEGRLVAANATDVEATCSLLSQVSGGHQIRQSASRPDVPGFIRKAVEATGGETGVVVCGGTSLVANTRLSVARLSDERAVHKGTGAQGIHLHVEEYCF